MDTPPTLFYIKSSAHCYIASALQLHTEYSRWEGLSTDVARHYLSALLFLSLFYLPDLRISLYDVVRDRFVSSSVLFPNISVTNTALSHIICRYGPVYLSNRHSTTHSFRHYAFISLNMKYYNVWNRCVAFAGRLHRIVLISWRKTRESSLSVWNFAL